MPNVPNVPGVPALSSYSAEVPVLLVADTALAIQRALHPQWGVYSAQGDPIIATSLSLKLGLGSIVSALNSISSILTKQTVADQFSVVDFEYKKDWTISDYPVEDGAFQSFDKVEHPFDVRMRIAAGGSEANRTALLNRVQDVAHGLDLYTVITPEKSYPSCNIVHFDYRRMAASGLGLIVIDIWLVEVRPTATAAFSNTREPGVAGNVSLGIVQPVPYLGGNLKFT